MPKAHIQEKMFQTNQKTVGGAAQPNGCALVGLGDVFVVKGCEKKRRDSPRPGGQRGVDHCYRCNLQVKSSKLPGRTRRLYQNSLVKVATQNKHLGVSFAFISSELDESKSK